MLVCICRYGLDYFLIINYTRHIKFYPLPINTEIISLFVVLTAALISDKICKGKRLPVIDCLILFLIFLLLYFQISPSDSVNANLVYIGWTILIQSVIALLLYAGSVEIGEKKYAAARFGLYSLFMQLAANLNCFIMTFFNDNNYINHYMAIAVWFYIIVLVIALFVLSLLKLKHKKL